MENILDPKTNKQQALIKLQIAKDNLEGVDQALNQYSRPRIEQALSLIQEVLKDLNKERENNFK
tara:strand:- start:340 stop:531 length:192 start_codon:yes stop_codon:yes gene_type:complete